MPELSKGMSRPIFLASALLLSTFGAGCALDTLVLTEERNVSLPEPVKHPKAQFVPLSFEHVADLPSDEVPADKIDSVKLKRLEVIIPDPTPTRNFNFVTQLQVFLQTPKAPSRLVASKGVIEPNASVATLVVQDIELKDYLAKNDAQIRVRFEGGQPEEQLDVRVEADFLINVAVKEALF